MTRRTDIDKALAFLSAVDRDPGIEPLLTMLHDPTVPSHAVAMRHALAVRMARSLIYGNRKDSDGNRVDPKAPAAGKHQNDSGAYAIAGKAHIVSAPTVRRDYETYYGQASLVNPIEDVDLEDLGQEIPR